MFTMIHILWERWEKLRCILQHFLYRTLLPSLEKNQGEGRKPDFKNFIIIKTYTKSTNFVEISDFSCLETVNIKNRLMHYLLNNKLN